VAGDESTPPLLELRSPECVLRIDAPKRAADFPPPERPPHFRARGRDLETFVRGEPFRVPLALPALFEECRYELTLSLRGSSTNVAEVEFRAIDRDVFAAVVARTPDYPVLSGPVELGGFVGDLAFDVVHGHRRLLSVELEVFPTKLSYLEDYLALLEAVATRERTLPFRMAAPTTTPHAIDQARTAPSQSEWLAILRWQGERLCAALTGIRRRPHQELRREALVRPAALVRQASARAGAWLARHPQYARPGAPPERLVDERRILTLDTPENRYVAGRVRRWQLRLKRLLVDHPRLAPGLERLYRALEAFCDDPRFASLASGRAPCSHTLQHQRDYRGFAAIDRLLRRSLTRQRDGQVPMTLKSLPVLYEYWVLLEVHAVLVQRLGFVCMRPPPLQRGAGAMHLADRGCIDYEGAGGSRATLTYQGLFRRESAGDDDELEDPGRVALGELRSYTSAQCPDGLLVLSLVREARPVCVVIDAKYRLSRRTGGPRLSNVNAMHRYRDALLFERAAREEKDEPTYAVTKAWFVYPSEPGGLKRRFEEIRPREKDHRARLWHAAMTLGVGAIPALPGRSDLLGHALEHVVSQPPADLDDARPRTTHPSRVRLDGREPCLWAVVPSAERLEKHVEERLYHVPAHFVRDPAQARLLLLGVRRVRPDGSRAIEYPAYVYQCDFVDTRPRAEFPPRYLGRLGPSSHDPLPESYHLLRLRERVELALPGPTVLPAEGVGDYFGVQTFAEVLAWLSGGQGA